MKKETDLQEYLASSMKLLGLQTKLSIFGPVFAENGVISKKAPLKRVRESAERCYYELVRLLAADAVANALPAEVVEEMPQELLLYTIQCSLLPDKEFVSLDVGLGHQGRSASLSAVIEIGSMELVVTLSNDDDSPVAQTNQPHYTITSDLRAGGYETVILPMFAYLRDGTLPLEQ